MKKTYNAPVLRIVTINTVKVISGSLNSLDVNTSGGPVDKNNAWTRQDNNWDIWGDESSDE